jgi:RNA polymerase sigma factor (sigma-70 family)
MATDDEPPTTSELEDRVDRELLAQWVDGIREAGDKLTIRYFRRLRSFFIQRVAGEHEDLVNETCCRLAESKQKYRGEAPVRVFVFGIARNVLLQYLRKKSRQPEFSPYTSSLGEAVGRRPSSMLAETEEHRIMRDAMQDIPVNDYDLLAFHYWTGMTGPELRALFEVPEGTIRGRLAAARKRLRKRFDELSTLPRERLPTEELFEQWLRELREAS